MKKGILIIIIIITITQNLQNQAGQAKINRKRHVAELCNNITNLNINNITIYIS